MPILKVYKELTYEEFITIIRIGLNKDIVKLIDTPCGNGKRVMQKKTPFRGNWYYTTPFDIYKDDVIVLCDYCGCGENNEDYTIWKELYLKKIKKVV